MSTKANYFKIGMFVVVATALFVAVVVTLGAGKLFRTKIMAETYINESVNGLDVGSPVKYRGVRIGSVRQIDFVHRVYGTAAAMSGDEGEDKPESRPVLVRFVIYPDTIGYKGEDLRDFLTHEIENGLRVRLSAQGITGMFYLEVDYPTIGEDEKAFEPPWVPDDFYIPAVSSSFQLFTEKLNEGLQQIEPQVIGEAIQELRDVSSTVSQFVANLDRANLGPGASQLMGNLNAAVEKFGNAAASVEKLAGDPAIAKAIEDLPRITGELHGFVQDLRGPGIRMLGSVGTAADNVSSASAALTALSVGVSGKLAVLDELEPALQRIVASAERIRDTLGNLQRLTARVDRILAGEEQTVQEFMDNLRSFSRDLKDFGQQAKRYPSQVFFGEPPQPIRPYDSAKREKQP